MMIYQVDAFCREIFSGNPAAVCPLERWPADELLQSIAAENNLAETAYYVRDGDRFHIRWFTPTVEVDLCGHATLATAHVLFEHEGYAGERIVFTSRSGELVVDRRDGLLHLNFPADVIGPVAVSTAMLTWFPGAPAPVEVYKGRSDYMLVFESEAVIASLEPDLAAIGKAREARGIIVTAAGARTAAAAAVDFVSRFFAPQSGIAEDPVTGSAHTTLVPYWARRLGKPRLTAMQLSARKGFLQCRDLGERVEISGAAKTYMEGRLML
ncbi:MAG TPA: PhzF family phenazine biosynthesis protein [Puia sp.]|nr:PhzF family phenazine biosynthesis protein [Puia sp.]